MTAFTALSPEAQAEFADACMDFWWYAQNAPFKIPDKGTRRLTKLAPNAAQRYVWRRKAEIVAAGELLRYCLPKPRQMGMTVSHAAEKLHIAHTQSNVEVYMLIHDLNPAAKLYKRIETMRNQMDPWFPKPNLASFSRGRQMEFDNGSVITIESVRKQGVGRAETLDHVHATELPSWDDAEGVLTGIEESVPDIPGWATSIALESTCEGVGDYWYWLVQKAKDRALKSQGYFLIFVPWWLESEYSHRGPIERLLRENPLTEGEQGLAKRIEAEAPSYHVTFTTEQIIRKLLWRRGKIERRDYDKFCQEYPMDIDEAFIGSGRPVFRSASVQYHRNRVNKSGIAEVRDPEHVMEVAQIGSSTDPGSGREKRKYTWRPRRSGNLKVWELPQEDARYIVSSDSASGEHVDKTALHVLKVDLPRIEQVAVWHGDLGAVETAYVQAYLGERYNGAFLAPENNNTGHTVVETLVDTIRVPHHRLYQYRVRDQQSGHEATRYGFNTNATTRPALIEDFAAYLLTDDLILHDSETMVQIGQFAYDKKTRKPQAPSGAHDDVLLALMIGVYARHSMRTGSARRVTTRGPRYERKRRQRLSSRLRS